MDYGIFASIDGVANIIVEEKERKELRWHQGMKFKIDGFVKSGVFYSSVKCLDLPV